MDLLFYFVFFIFMFSLLSSYLFFSRLSMIRLLQQGSYKKIGIISSFFFTFFFVSVQFLYSFFLDHFLVEPLWYGTLLVFCLYIISLFIIIRMILPSVPENIQAIYFQDVAVVAHSPSKNFEHYVKICKKNHAEILLESPESAFMIAQLCVDQAEKKQEYVVEVKMEPCFWNKSRIYFLCYPAQRGVFVEKNDFKKVIALFSLEEILLQNKN